MASSLVDYSDVPPQNGRAFKNKVCWSKESIVLENLLHHLLIDSDCDLPHAEVLLNLNNYEKINITETIILSFLENKDNFKSPESTKLISIVTSQRKEYFTEEDFNLLALSMYNSFCPSSAVISTIQKQEDYSFEWRKGSAVLKCESTYDGSVHIRPLCTSNDISLAITDLMDLKLFSRGFIQITPYTITQSRNTNNKNAHCHINDNESSNKNGICSYMVTEKKNNTTSEIDGFFRYTYRKNRRGAAGEWKYMKLVTYIQAF